MMNEETKTALLAAAQAGRAIELARDLRAKGVEVTDRDVADAMQASGDLFGAARFRNANPLAYVSPATAATPATTPANPHRAEYERLRASDPFAAARYGADHADDVYSGGDR